MIDVHILTTTRLSKEWEQQCRDSVQRAIENSSVPVVLHLLPENTEDFWKARWDGYMLGEQEWVTYVDVDDWVSPELFRAVLPHLSGDTDTLQTKGYDYHVKYSRTYPSDRGVRFHRRTLVDQSGGVCTHKCCPSCHMFYSSQKSKIINDRLATFRVGYTSLAQQWRRENGMD